ncbi:ArsR/SmtB family transcription factor [Bordetella trematum]|uniref:ArsR/SmtB family transcription factor n=1 Tax=Bordetella trematum TaxID=123899 RepID=UPI000D98B194|nr:winged helix-turn-helix domain-containing protein [Bordetella trematum]SPU50538.1 ArsR family transcriptional regulator [Bordetella trematum]VDH06777.1 Uncharacterized protein conserved in archaea [Bordetella trematum]
MLSIAAFAHTASLLGDLARASMLTALMDGRARSAAELARIAGIAPQTASAHLANLVEAGLLLREHQGRHRYHRLASPAVAHLIESLMALSSDPDAPRRKLPQCGPRDPALRYARSCYDHLAGEVAVAISDRLIALGHLELTHDGGLLTASGEQMLGTLGVDIDAARQGSQRRSGRAFCRPCLDWSERRPHLAGALGAALLRCCLEKDWLRRRPDSRVISLTPTGRQALQQAFGLALLRD